MKANDLRIGNLVDLGNRIAKIVEIGHLSCAVADLEETQDTIEDYERTKPILLTEDWLLKFGFEQTFISKIHLTFSKGSFCLLKRVNHIQIWYESIDIKYVHQLQNLYYALTNQELTIQ
jgi:hypothetical protein